jgi:sugar O-acyltransferase (sialic acid O-acetyltransferase NeuD family)
MSIEQKKEVVIFGGGKLATYAHTSLDNHSNGKFKVAAFTMNEQHVRKLEKQELRGLAVTPFEGLIESFPPDRYSMLIAVGSSRLNHARAEIYNQCKEQGYELIKYIHPKAEIGDEVEIGDNTLILQNNNIDHFVKIGDDTFLWAANHIGHESVIGNHVFITSGVIVSGSCQIGDYSFIGVNAALADGAAVGKNNFIGMGVNITGDTVDGSVYKPDKIEPKPYNTDRMIGLE